MVRYINNLKDLDEKEHKDRSRIHLKGKTSALAWISRGLTPPVLFVLPDKRTQEDFLVDWASISGKDKETSVLLELPLTQEGFENEALKIKRGQTLVDWNNDKGYMVATSSSLMAPFILPGRVFQVKRRNLVDRDELLEWLSKEGYERVDIVWLPGQYVSRGSIVDVFSPGDKNPVRIEFFDDAVESVRFFRIEDQRSIELVDEVCLLSLKGRGKTPLRDLIPLDTKVVLYEPSEIDKNASDWRWLAEAIYKDAKGGDLVSLSWGEVLKSFSDVKVFEVTKNLALADFRTKIEEIPPFKGDVRAYRDFVRYWIGKSYDVHVFCSDKDETLLEHNNSICVKTGKITGGFIDHYSQVVYLSEFELHGIPIANEREVSSGPPLEWNELVARSTYVVHEDYGIAKNLGLETLTIDGMSTDFVVLEFTEKKRLMVPLLQLYKITPYYVPETLEVKLDSLRGKAWAKSKAKARERAQKAAEMLVAMYSQRETIKAKPCSKDGEIIKKLESDCPFPLTKDQEKAVMAIKKDLESDRPMDRLLVGDVGIGKTEVAIRAAVKMVENGRQVFVLAPTTILSQQHYRTFKIRCAGLPINIEHISRFSSSSEERRIKEKLASGEVDILIGTHKLLQKDVKVKDLGLVIIDEEHRFGVLHKELPKFIDPSVHVLTMTATPIPRTLYLALGGLRDLSIINTQPYRRKPVITYIGTWDPLLVKQAILREKNRGGQVFYIHNRVETISQRASFLSNLLPGVRLGVAHGRMKEKELSRVMDKFIAKEIDVLLCTTIVESGLDIPSANTLIVDNSQDLGLAQLYQLRGRIGRREEQAFAFFMYPKEEVLTIEARERLEAIADLGEGLTGYELARRDLQIRGGGEILGLRQHGHMERVGFHLYCKMLEEEVRKIRGKEEESLQTHVDVRLPLSFPSHFMPQSSVRVAFFRRLLRSESLEEVYALEGEARDRFGKLPESMKFLFAIARVKLIGPKVGITSVRCTEEETLVWSKSKDIISRLPSKEWFYKSDGSIVGPGGYRGLPILDRALLSFLGMAKEEVK